MVYRPVGCVSKGRETVIEREGEEEATFFWFWVKTLNPLNAMSSLSAGIFTIVILVIGAVMVVVWR